MTPTPGGAPWNDNEHEGDGGWMDMDDVVHGDWRAMWEEVWDILEGIERARDE